MTPDDETPDLPPDPLPSIREIAELTVRLRRLSAAGCDADPAERAVILADKDALIARIPVDQADQVDRDTDHARTVPGTPRRDEPPTDSAAVRALHRLGRELAATRLRYANLLAAARAALAAARDDEPDAWEYLADELAAQHGQHDLGRQWWDETGRWDGAGR